MSMNISSSNSSNLQTAASLLQQLNTISNPAGTGLPVSQYVQDLQEILQQELEAPIQNQISTLQSQQNAYSALQSALQTFQQATETLASLQSWSTTSASSTNSSVATVSVSPGANVGTYNIQVTQLAQAEMQVQTANMQTSATGTSSLTAGTLSIQPTQLNNGQAVQISISSGESLQDIANAVNQYTQQTGVAASVVSNGQGAYFLALSSIQTGSNYGFQVTDTVSGGSGGQFGFQTLSNAQDAEIVLGSSSGTSSSGSSGTTVTLTSSTNTFQNMIPGLTINAISTGSTTVSVVQNTSGAKSAVTTWMNAYNTLVDTLRQDTAYTAPSSGATNGSSPTVGPLFGDPLAQSMVSELASQAMQAVSAVNSQMNSLASIGIVLDPSSGHLEFQSPSGFSSAAGTLPDGQQMFDQALTNNLSDVEQLFGVVNTTASQAIPTSGVLGNLYNYINVLLEGNPNGTGQSPISTAVQSLSQQQSTLQNYLNTVQQQIQQRVQEYEAQLNQLNEVMAQMQAQMQQLSAMFGQSSNKTTG
ncbi:flagellar filament capping protein FliD [Alicyclobacillus vulcanalis]|uniref:Flagellar hook-associated protein 2 n=1 Tax=Alicyclobacillus vulcanalis TaxID=252246 RepID=A0A1N7JNY7_9BACL|nr:flagellar filament capping protein FliD [Alicyclobacillus vulcanalis]SIS51025.1 flagellar hook-associated protein 2 [Alicyclobacillus vulcanalis]